MEYVRKFLHLLELERAAEEAENRAYISEQLVNPKQLESRGICIQKLQVTNQTTGLYGRQVVSFELFHGSRKHPLILPSSSITTGSIIGVFVSGKNIGEQLVSGVVVRVSSTRIQVAFDELPEDVNFHAHAGKLQLVKMSNTVTHRRMKAALERMQSSNLPPAVQHFVAVLHGEAPLGVPDPTHHAHLQHLNQHGQDELSDFSFINPNLDLSQKKAVTFALCRPDVAVIHGPPGTGKTTTIIEVILQAIKTGTKVLACAPSNIAVDNLVERLANARAKVVRLGHPARLVEAIQSLSLDALLLRSDSASIIRDVRVDLERAINNCGKSCQASDKRKWRAEIKTLRKELKEREKRVIVQLLSGVDVVLATTTGASPEGPISYLPDGHFGLVIIDECAQAVEVSCWVPLLNSSKCVLAGDHKQLPPTIISLEAASKGLSVSLMERLVDLYGDSVTAMLTTQYRMNEIIMQWPSDYLYNGSLVAHQSVAKHRLSDCPGVVGSAVTDIPLLFIDTAGLDLTELPTSDEESKGNEGECDLVLHHLKSLQDAGVPPRDIAVIAPYNLQVELIRQRLPALKCDYSELEVRSVDGFQGREKEAVIISFTRSNPKGQYGFLEEVRRSNVAITRARRHLALIGDSDTLNNEPFLKGMLAHCNQHGEVWSAHEYIHASDFQENRFYNPESSATAKGRPSCSVSHKLPSVSRVSASGQSGKISHQSLLMRGNKPQSARMKRKQKFEPHKSSLGNENPLDETSSMMFESQLKAFMSNESESVLSFPSSLTSQQRRRIHELCEEMGLVHASTGQEPDRYIVARKPSGKNKVSTSIGTSSVGSDQDDTLSGQATSEKIFSGEIVEYLSQEDVPKENLAAHEVDCSKPCVKKLRVSSVTAKEESKSRKNTKKKKTQPANSEDDLDSLLAEMTLSDSICNYANCRKKVNMIGLRCQFCGRRYCMEHGIPEVHGCGEEAKRYARKAQHKPGYSSSQAARRSNLHKKLEKKLEDVAKKRRSKK